MGFENQNVRTLVGQILEHAYITGLVLYQGDSGQNSITGSRSDSSKRCYI